jgi:hypothetical protein
VVYRPDGTPHSHISRKVFPVHAERGFTTPGKLEDQGIYRTEAGLVFKTLNCADGWFPQSYRNMREHGVEAIVAFSYLMGSQSWRDPWVGYPDGDPRFMPPDVDRSRIGRIPEEHAWDLWGPAGRLPHDVPHMMKVVLRGELWEIGADGTTTVINRRVGSHVHKLRYFPDRPYVALASSWL